MGKNNWLLGALCAVTLIAAGACGDDSSSSNGGTGGSGGGDGDGDGSGGTSGDGDGDGDGDGADAGDNGGPDEDPNCPHYIGTVMNMDIDLPGCCADSGQCGVISSISMTCITESQYLTDLAPGDACGDSADAGI